MINVKDGSIEINNGSFVITRGMALDEFVLSEMFKDVYTQQKTTWTVYFIKPQSIGTEKFIIGLNFNPDNSLEKVDLKLNEDGKIPRYEDWSYEEERNLEMKHDEWIREHCGRPPRSYEWGSISSVYDQKSASSEIIVKYNL